MVGIYVRGVQAFSTCRVRIFRRYMLHVFRRSGRVVLGDLGDPTGAWSSGVRSSVLRTVSRIGRTTGSYLKLGGSDVTG